MTVVIGRPAQGSHTATAIGPGSVEAATIRLRAARSTPSWAASSAAGASKAPAAWASVRRRRRARRCAPTLSARVRTLETGHGRKDHIDGRVVLTISPASPRMITVACCGCWHRRDELTSERRRTINRLHRHLRDLIAGGAPTQLSTKTAAALLAKVRPADGVEAERKQMARDLLVDVRRLDRALAQNRRRCAAAVAASGNTLTQLAGATCSPPRSSATSATSAERRLPRQLREAPRPSKPAAAKSCATDSRHGNRQLNTPSTSPPTPRPSAPAPDATTTSADATPATAATKPSGA